ncbi:hypothetical protein C8R47DRAFT_512787 [Mycena vitilis]|nr:hypothetical protein C8R47DRAFT_512787 [Mycena vitilis]
MSGSRSSTVGKGEFELRGRVIRVKKVSPSPALPLHMPASNDSRPRGVLGRCETLRCGGSRAYAGRRAILRLHPTVPQLPQHSHRSSCAAKPARRSLHVAAARATPELLAAYPRMRVVWAMRSGRREESRRILEVRGEKDADGIHFLPIGARSCRFQTSAPAVEWGERRNEIRESQRALDGGGRARRGKAKMLRGSASTMQGGREGAGRRTAGGR